MTELGLEDHLMSSLKSFCVGYKDMQVHIHFLLFLLYQVSRFISLHVMTYDEIK